MKLDITLPDGSVRSFENSITGDELAKNIGSRLHKDAICIEIDNKFYDLSYSCLLYTSPSPRDCDRSRMPSSA